MDRRAITARRVIAAILGFGLSWAGLYFALRGLTWSSLVAQFQSIDWRWALISAGATALTYIVQGFRWGVLLEPGAGWKTTRAVYVGLFLNEILPFRPGEAIRVWLAARNLGRTPWSVIPSVVVERLMDGFWLALALAAASLVVPLPHKFEQHTGWLFFSVGAILLLMWILGKTWLAKHRLAWNRPAWLLSAVALVAQGLAFWAAIRADNLHLAMAEGFAVMLIVRLGTMLPAAPANLGTHQFATVWGLALFGVAQSAGAAASLVIFSILTIPLVVIGALTCISEGLSFGEIRKIELDTAPPVLTGVS
jgi:uncharacterized membrane protein YbhN (UPF0104 family)